MKRLAMVFAVILVLSAGGCSEIGLGFETPTPPSGVRGMVLLGPTCPTGSEPGAHDPVPCLTPYAAELVVLDLENVVVARVTAGADGQFTLDLAPGEYVITPAGGNPYPIAQPVPVTVVAGQYVEVEINYDTGIR